MPSPLEPSPDQFPTTHWSLVNRLHSADVVDRSRALNDLCLQYHYPLYCYIRRRGLNHHDAQDALHDFLSRLLRLGSLEAADEEKGRLRSYLLTALQRFLINWQRDQRHRQHELQVETERLLMHAEQRYQQERFSDGDSPDRIYQRKWAAELLQGVLQRLREDYELRQRGRLFEVLRPVLMAGGSLKGEDSAALARQLEITPGALRISLLRLLRDYRRLLKQEILQTVRDPEEAKEEFNVLKQLFTR